MALLALALLPLASGACSDPKAPNEVGINLGAPDTAWAAKNKEQKFGWMAAQVHPKMQKLFIDYNPRNRPFTCEDCHSDAMEQIDFKMPTDSLYSLPKDGPLDDAIDYDAEISLFMVSKVTPLLNQLMNTGEGPKTEVTCFNCHPSSS
jgi:hypothetical protein